MELESYFRAHYHAGHRLPGLFLLKRQARIGQVIEQLYLLWIASRLRSMLIGFFTCPCDRSGLAVAQVQTGL